MSGQDHERAAPLTYRFGTFEVDAAAYEVRRDGVRLRLSRQPMELLLLLLEHRQHLVSREEMVQRLWRPDVFTDPDAGIHTAILKIRQALGDSRDAPRFIETVTGRGYRFIARVDVVASAGQHTSALPAASAQSAHPRRDNLPSELTTFVGRCKELAELPGMIATSRLLSLTGAGGVGKTRLAVRLASGLIDRFPDGVWLVDLAPLSAPDLLPHAIATALDVQEGPRQSAREALLNTLRDRELLLVMDTCEHLISACADLAAEILRSAAAVRILATSREALGVSGEIVYRVPSLSLPESAAVVSPDLLSQAEATQLFIERGLAVHSSFAPTHENAAAIARICRRLDGIPLAIELAAARVMVLSPEQIEARLEDRFRLLTGGIRTGVARQRTLEATMQWSYELLADAERQLLDRLSVFPAAWTLAAAEHVCGGEGVDPRDVLDLLSRLVSKSLVVVDREWGSDRWYRCLETVRQFAGERLVQAGAADRWRDRHFAFFFNEFRGARPVLRGPDQVALLRRLRIEEENIRAALEWGLTSAALAEPALELAGALFWFWTKRSQFDEGRRWLERALAAGSDSPVLRGRALIGLANIHYFQRIDGRAVVTEALALGRAVGDAWVVSVALFIQSLVALERGDHDEAVARALEAREAATAGGGAVEHGGPLLVLGHAALARGDHERAQHFYDESIEVHRQAGETWGSGIQLVAAAAMRTLRGDYDQAHRQASEALSLFQQLEDPRGIAWSLEVFAGLLAAGGDAEGAACVWAASFEFLRRMGVSLPPNIRSIRDRYTETVKASLGQTRFDIVSAEGRAMSLSHAISRVR